MTRQGLVVDDLTLSLTRRGRVVPLVEGVSFGVGAGETLGLVGESGSGKTLTSLSLLRLLPPGIEITAGSIRLDGDELTAMPETALRRIRGRRIAMVFQEPMTSLNPAFTVGNQLIEAVRSHTPGIGRDKARTRAAELLDLVGIPTASSRLADYPHQFSGGMRQRVMIALALSGEPDVLVADEPTTALDVTIQAQILDLLRRLQNELEMAMVVVTHDLGVVAEVCDRIAVMYAGQVVETGGIDGAFAVPAHPYTAGLLAAMPRLDAELHRLPSIPGLVPAPGDHPPGCPFGPRCSHAIASCTSGTPPEPVPAAHGGEVRCVRAGDLDLAPPSGSGRQAGTVTR